jgi:hypothetical protein
LRLKIINFEEGDDEKEPNNEEMQFKDQPKKMNFLTNTGFEDTEHLELQSENEDEAEDEEEKGTQKQTQRKEHETNVDPGSRIGNVINEVKEFTKNLNLLLGDYLAKRKESKYEIIETVMKMVVFGESDKAEIKFLEDALKHTHYSDTQTRLKRYMKKKGMLLTQGRLKKAAKEKAADKANTTKTEVSFNHYI